MRKFDYTDYTANPGKYRLFKTARIATHLFTNNGEHDLHEGTFVGITYHCTARNQLYRRDEPLYRLSGSNRIVYANVLCDFVL